MRINPQSMEKPPSTGSKLELCYALMREAEAQVPGDAGRFRAMDCHNDIMDLAADDRGVNDAVYNLGLYGRILDNQERLGC